MLKIESYTVERLDDPFGILTGERYEFFLELDVPEEDELYSENGVMLRVIFLKDEEKERISKYEFIENETKNVLDFELEEDEETAVLTFCREHYDAEEDDSAIENLSN
ncbi:pullulanase [Bacillus sp. FJAT-27916]|uniref:DUF6509 family protein n=1 Tax=Bacillaceae TaxID=186817 RepID=UPI000670E6BD|nr:DUF6509 family protein [Bacillus sp. FJAT-27916]KMY43344.1 pullulanase [Bacillus sp. FJAT-27916]